MHEPAKTDIDFTKSACLTFLTPEKNTKKRCIDEQTTKYRWEKDLANWSKIMILNKEKH